MGRSVVRFRAVGRVMQAAEYPVPLERLLLGSPCLDGGHSSITVTVFVVQLLSKISRMLQGMEDQSEREIKR